VLAALPASTAPSDAATDPSAEPDIVRPELVELIDGFVQSSRSGAVGAIGALTLILIVIQLFTSIETAFNDIWGVQRGRSWLTRIVWYWTILTLGSVLFFSALTGLSAGAFFNTFAARIPYADQLVSFLRLLLPAGSLVLLVAVLATFYRIIPNTRVTWFAAFIGAALVALLLVGNNTLAFLYFRRVFLSKSLYGSLGILPILMFGLYVFWFFVLLGGQVSYAVQNARFRNSQVAWQHLDPGARIRLSLLVLLAVCRRFHACLHPCSASQLGTLLQVPTQLLNECLNRLVRMGLLTPIPADDGGTGTDARYQPARPLSRTTLGDFRRRDEACGEADEIPIEALDPLLNRFAEARTAFLKTDFFSTPLDRLFDQHPMGSVAGSPFPFALPGETPEPRPA
jgi:membrane protein